MLNTSYILQEVYVYTCNTIDYACIYLQNQKKEAAVPSLSKKQSKLDEVSSQPGTGIDKKRELFLNDTKTKQNKTESHHRRPLSSTLSHNHKKTHTHSSSNIYTRTWRTTRFPVDRQTAQPLFLLPTRKNNPDPGLLKFFLSYTPISWNQWLLSAKDLRDTKHQV